MKISINCPSYKRPKVRTLEYLPFCKVWVSEEELPEYQRQNPGASFGVLSRQGNVSIARNEILRQEFEAGADVVCIVDDDIKALYRFDAAAGSAFGYEKKKLQTEDFEEFIYNGTVMARDFGAFLWGVNLNKDSLCYKHSRPLSTAAIILGPFSCHLRGTECFYDERIPLKEDYDMALQHLNRYRKILRLNMYHYDCKQSEQAGGCAAIRNYKMEKQQFDLLQKKWGSDIVRIDTSSKKERMDYNPIIRVPIPGV